MQLRKVAFGLLIVLSLSTLTACGAGQNAASRNIFKVTDGAETDVVSANSNIKLRGFVVVAQPDGTGVIVGSIINALDKDDQLLGISVNNSLATITADSRAVVKDLPIIFEGASANAKAVVTGLGLKAGVNVELSFFFENAGVVTVSAIVRDKRDDYANITN